MLAWNTDVYETPYELVEERGSFLAFYEFLVENFSDDGGDISAHVEVLKGFSPKKRLSWLKNMDNFNQILDALDWCESDIWHNYLLKVAPVKPWEEYEVCVDDDCRIQVRKNKLSFMPSEQKDVAAVVAYLIKSYHVSAEDITEALL